MVLRTIHGISSSSCVRYVVAPRTPYIHDNSGIIQPKCSFTAGAQEKTPAFSWKGSYATYRGGRALLKNAIQLAAGGKVVGVVTLLMVCGSGTEIEISMGGKGSPLGSVMPGS